MPRKTAFLCAASYNSSMSSLTRDTITRLIQINKQFYQTFAPEFSATRHRLQPGVQRLLSSLPPQADLLDLGCGNGEMWRILVQRGHQGRYVGLDFSQEFLAEARQAAVRLVAGNRSSFFPADLTQPGWEQPVLEQMHAWGIEPFPGFDRVLSFAVLHHIPGSDLRLQLLKEVRNLVSPQGLFIHSVWQFLSSPRLRTRIQDWSAVGLQAEQVEPGDYLMDWRAGGQGYRYVHHFTPEELGTLAAQAGFEVLETFLSDGEGGNLGLYQVWSRASG